MWKSIILKTKKTSRGVFPFTEFFCAVMFGSLTAFSLLLMLRSTESTCYSSTTFGERARKEGYAECTTERNLMYLQGLGLNEPKTSLKDIAMGRCCQPSSLHQDWPYTCHSADWELSFSRYSDWPTIPYPKRKQMTKFINEEHMRTRMVLFISDCPWHKSIPSCVRSGACP